MRSRGLGADAVSCLHERSRHSSTAAFGTANHTAQSFPGSGFGQTAERPVRGAEPMTEFDPSRTVRMMPPGEVLGASPERPQQPLKPTSAGVELHSNAGEGNVRS